MRESIIRILCTVNFLHCIPIFLKSFGNSTFLCPVLTIAIAYKVTNKLAWTVYKSMTLHPWIKTWGII